MCVLRNRNKIKLLCTHRKRDKPNWNNVAQISTLPRVPLNFCYLRLFACFLTVANRASQHKLIRLRNLMCIYPKSKSNVRFWAKPTSHHKGSRWRNLQCSLSAKRRKDWSQHPTEKNLQRQQRTTANRTGTILQLKGYQVRKDKTNRREEKEPRREERWKPKPKKALKKKCQGRRNGNKPIEKISCFGTKVTTHVKYQKGKKSNKTHNKTQLEMKWKK